MVSKMVHLFYSGCLCPGRTVRYQVGQAGLRSFSPLRVGDGQAKKNPDTEANRHGPVREVGRSSAALARAVLRLAPAAFAPLAGRLAGSHSPRWH